MFDIGFFEICLIGIIALIVIGPEKLPRVARTTGLWLGKVRATVRTVKHDIDEQLRADELKQSLEQAKNTLSNGVTTPVDDIKASLENLQKEAHDATSVDDKKPTLKTTNE